MNPRLVALVSLAALLWLGCEEKKPAPASNLPKITAPGAGEPKAAGASAAEALAAQAQTLIDSVNQAIKERRFDAAESALQKAEALKDQLSSALQAKVDAARKALESAKTEGGQ
jgi:hypothetical protein